METKELLDRDIEFDYYIFSIEKTNGSLGLIKELTYSFSPPRIITLCSDIIEYADRISLTDGVLACLLKPLQISKLDEIMINIEKQLKQKKR